MRLSHSAIQLFLLSSCWTLTACTLGDESTGRLAAYLQSPQGSAEWKSDEQRLAREADAAAAEYRRVRTLEARND